jgi:hypothetical protein
MKPTQLQPGKNYAWQGRMAEFLRRIPAEPGGALSAINVFRVPDFIGLNSPQDQGLTHFSDAQVSKVVQDFVSS